MKIFLLCAKDVEQDVKCYHYTGSEPIASLWKTMQVEPLHRN